MEKVLADLSISITRSACKIKAVYPGGTVSWEKALDLAEAAKAPLSEERIKEEFSNWETAQFRAGKMDIEIRENPFLPASILKTLRKECCNCFAEKMPEKLDGDAAENEITLLLENFRNSYRKILPYRGEFQGNTVLLPRQKKWRAPSADNRKNVICRLPEDAPSPHEEFFFPFYVNESNLTILEEKFFSFLEKGGFQARISSLYCLILIKNAVKKWEMKNGVMKKNLSIRTAMPLHICNSFAVSLLAASGVNMVQASCELGRSEMEELCAKSPLPVEIYVSGRPVLLGTRAFLPVEGKMEDSKGEVFLVEKEGVLTLILPEKILDIPVCKNAAGAFYDLRYIPSGRDEKKARFNFDVSLA